MPEQDANDAKQFFEDVPQQSVPFYLKGSGAYDWGCIGWPLFPARRRPKRYSPPSQLLPGRPGLEPVDQASPSLVPDADALMQGHAARSYPTISRDRGAARQPGGGTSGALERLLSM